MREISKEGAMMVERQKRIISRRRRRRRRGGGEEIKATSKSTHLDELQGPL